MGDLWSTHLRLPIPFLCPWGFVWVPLCVSLSMKTKTVSTAGAQRLAQCLQWGAALGGLRKAHGDTFVPCPYFRFHIQVM